VLRKINSILAKASETVIAVMAVMTKRRKKVEQLQIGTFRSQPMSQKRAVAMKTMGGVLH
jgi:hypothetical protein